MAAAILIALLASPFQPAPATVRAASASHVAIIVGPVGEELTPTYIELAEMAAGAAERHGAVVARAYSPNASPARVLDAVAGADIVIYFGHGTGFPNPYSDTLNPDTVNGWGLQGPGARGTHEDSVADGTLAYYGEAWIAANARPAPGFVMIYSNVCYAPGAGEGAHPPSSPEQARQRAGGYARTPLAMGASAVFATDFYAGAADLVERLLSSPTVPYGDIVRSGSHYLAEGVSIQAHPYAADAELWLQRSPYFGGRTDYWYAFSGDPSASLAADGSRLDTSYVGALAQPSRLSLQAGAHRAIRLGDDGRATDTIEWTAVQTSSLIVDERRSLAGADGIWFRIADGDLAGAWIAESPRVYLPGLALVDAFDPERVVHLAPGTHAGYRLTDDGEIAESVVVTLDRTSRASASSQALIDGQAYVHIVDGIWADTWVLASDAVRPGGPVALPPVSTTLQPEPPPLQPMPPEPPAPDASAATPPSPSSSIPPPLATPSPSMAPSPSSPAPPVHAMSRATPAPSPSTTPSPTPTASPSLTPLPSSSSPAPTARPSAQP